MTFMFVEMKCENLFTKKWKIVDHLTVDKICTQGIRKKRLAPSTLQKKFERSTIIGMGLRAF